MKKLICLMLLLPSLAIAERDPEELEQRLISAQKELAELAREIAELSREMGLSGGERSARAMAMMRHRGEGMRPQGRRQLGLLLTSEDSDQGLTVVGLTPSGPARTAGLERGDIVLAVNGESLAGASASELARIVQAMAADQPAILEIDRKGERMQVEIVPSPPGRMETTRLGDIDFDGLAEWGRVLADSLKENLGESLGESLGELDLSGLMEWVDSGRQGPGVFALSLPYMPGGGLLPGRLIANHEGLAPYFGTGEGVLVLDVRADNPWALVAGDVILAVDGQPVSRPVDIGRQMRLGNGGTIEIEIMRAGAVEFLEVTPVSRRQASD